MLTVFKGPSFNFHPDEIIRAEKLYKGKWLGSWAVKTKNGSWSEAPVDVFYVADPDISKGHVHYLGLFVTPSGMAYKTDASSFKGQDFIGILEDGIVYISKFRHDFIETPKGKIIDGGRDYIRTDGSDTVLVSVKNGEFKLKDDYDNTY